MYMGPYEEVDMLSDEEELEKIKNLEKAISDESAFVDKGILEWDDYEKLKFHKYVKGIAQKLLGNLANLDDENLVFLLSKNSEPSAAVYTKSREKFVFFSKGLLDICENEDQFAFILAHELQHWLECKDLHYGIHTDSHDDEIGAAKPEEIKCDILAIEKMRTGGYDIEEGYQITKKLLNNQCENIFRVLDEHPLDEHRVKYIGVKALQIREERIKSGQYDEKPPAELYNPDISRWKYSALERFFMDNAYAKAKTIQKIKLWFEQFDKLSKGPNGLQEISKKDLLALQNEHNKFFNEIRKNVKVEKAYAEMYCDRVLAPESLSEFKVFYSNIDNSLLYFNPQSFGARQIKQVIDYFKGFRESVGEETKLYCAKLGLLRKAFNKNHCSLLDLSDNPKNNVGVRFSQDVIEAIKDSYFPVSDYIGIIDNQNSDLIIFIDNRAYQLDKDYTIQKYLGTKRELKRIQVAKEYNDYFEFYEQLQSGELPFDYSNFYKLLDFCSEINGMEKEDFYALKNYLSPDAVKYLQANFKKKSFWNEKIVDLVCKDMKKDRTEEELIEYDDFINDVIGRVYSQISNFSEQKKMVDTYFQVGLKNFPRAACDVTAKMLAKHLEAGKDLDDFQFPYDKQYYEANERLIRNGVSPVKTYRLREYAYLELLKKNPKIDLSLTSEIIDDRGNRDSYFSWYFPSVLKITDKRMIYNVLYNRLYDNITNLDNWGDGSSTISDLPYYQRVVKALSNNLLLHDDVSNQIDIDTLRNHYKRAPIDDKIEYVVGLLEAKTVTSMYKNMFSDDNWVLYQEDLLNKDIPLEKRLQFAEKIRSTPEDERLSLIKDTLWDELQEKIASPELSITKKVELFNQIAKAEVLDSDKSKYIETLIGKNGKSGLLGEMNKSPEKSFEVYKKLLIEDNRIPDPKIRNQVIKMAVQQFVAENGNYNDITATEKEREDFILQVKQLKKQLKSEFSVVDEHEFLRCLANQTLSQQKLSGVIKPDPAEIDIKNQNVINAAYGLDGLTYLFNNEILDRNMFIEYMLSQGKKEDTKKIMDVITKYKESPDYRNYGLDKINESLFINAKKEFDQAPLPVQACIMTYLAKGCDWEQQFEFVANKLFYQTGELGEASKKFLRSYISSRPESERYFYLSAMYSASQNKSNFTENDEESKYTKEQRSVAEGLRLFLENSGPAGVKLAQAMSSYNGVPDFIKDEMQKAKNNANPPARWEVFDWLEQTHQTDVLEYGKIGELLGSASFFVTYDMIGNDGKNKVIKINRLGSANKAEVEFDIYKNTLEKLKDYFPQISSFKRLIDNAAQMVNVETDLSIGEEQLRYAKSIYPKKIEVDGQKFGIAVMDWEAYGQTWATMEKAHGVDFDKLEPDYKKKAAKAVFTMELSNMLSGHRFDSDRHAGQYKFDTKTNTIGIFDTGAISMIEPGEKEKMVLGRVLAQTVKALSGDNGENVGNVLSSEIDKGIEKYYQQEIKEGKPIPPYLSEFQRGLLALTDFHKELSSGELSVCLLKALNNDKHKLDPAIYQGFVSDMSEKSEVLMSEATKTLIGDTVVEAVLSPNQKENMTKEAQLGQRYGKLVFDKLINGEGSYAVLTNLPDDMKTKEFSEVMDSPIGRLHFAKGVMKSCLLCVDPRMYSSDDKRQLGAILYQIMVKRSRLKKLNQPLFINQIIKDVTPQFEPLGDYAKNICSLICIADKFPFDKELFNRAVTFGRIIDTDVRQGYVEAMCKSPDTSFVKKMLSHVSPLSLVPVKTARKIVKFMMKKVGPQCMDMVIKSVSKGRETHKEKSAER